jgi:hypothetical protein
VVPTIDGHAEVRVEPLVREWLLDLQILGRSATDNRLVQETH